MRKMKEKEPMELHIPFMEVVCVLHICLFTVSHPNLQTPVLHQELSWYVANDNISILKFWLRENLVSFHAYYIM